MRLISSSTPSALRGIGAVVASAAVVAAMAVTVPAHAEPVSTRAVSASAAGVTKVVKQASDGMYIVQLSAAPIATYGGSVDGLAATTKNGVPTARIADSAISAYRAYLDEQRASVLAAVPGVSPFYSYDTAFAGFAASMSYEQARTLAATSGVAAVTPNEIVKMDTSHTPTFLGLDAEGGLWEQLGGPENAGEGIVIGSIDSGFSPDSGSFAPLDEPAPIPDGWNGTCDRGEPDDLGGGSTAGEETGTQPAAIECNGDVVNNKVIGAHWYDAGQTPLTQEFLSPRDLNGHGSHTGSTAGGDYAVPITVGGAKLGKISGMAPRARISVYKTCWSQPDQSASCATVDTVAAIDQAVEDGVNVINYSIGGTSDTALDPDSVSFLGAAAAGVFVAVSGGNDGVPSSVAHNLPWVTTVAASTVDRAFHAPVMTADGEMYTGSGIPTEVEMTDAAYAGDIPADGQDPADAARCFVDSIDPAKAAGKIIVCDRGVNARVQKSAVVKAAGGVGMVLANDEASGTSTVTERHSVPTSHVSYKDGVAIKQYIEDAGADAMLMIHPFETQIGDGVTAPSMASFSSRGPGKVAGGDILKPDVTAPGVDILASLAPYADNFDEMYGFESGTSMSSPHVAGVAALEMALHPDWTPMEIKSALMTSAYQDNNQGDPIDLQGDPATPFEYGSGHIAPNDAASTPLVYNSEIADWIKFLCGTELPADDPNCESLGSIEPSDLNLASIAVHDVAGTRTVTRTLTNVTDQEQAATVDIEDPAGFTLTVDPSVLDIGPHETASYTVTITEDADVVPDTWQFGAVSWNGVRSPVAVQAPSLAASQLLVGEGSTGSVSDTTTAGAKLDVSVNLLGLAPAQVDAAVLENPDGSGFPTDDPATNDHVMKAVVEVPKGAALARFELFKDDYVEGTDLDMFVYETDADGNLQLVATSATGAVDEKVTLPDPDPGTYTVFVDLFSLAGGEDEADVFLHSFVVKPGGVGDLAADPAEFSTEIGGSQDVEFSWSNLKGPDSAASADAMSSTVIRYLGVAQYTAGDRKVATTLIRVDVGSSATPTETPTETPSQTGTPTPIGTLPHTGADGSTRTVGLVGLLALLAGGLLVVLARRRLGAHG